MRKTFSFNNLWENPESTRKLIKGKRLPSLTDSRRRDRGKKKSARASKEVEETGSRRGGRKADKTFEKEETTKARGRGKAPDAGLEDQKPKGGRRAKKTESTAEEKDTE